MISKGSSPSASELPCCGPEADMSSNPQIFVYLESPPLDENIPSHGLYRAGTPLLKAIRDRIAMIALYPVDRRYGASAVSPALRPLCGSLHKIFTLLRAVRKRLLPNDFENGLVAAIVSGWAWRSSALHIFALEGSDPEVLTRIGRIGAKAGKAFSVYLVDDFEWTNRLQGRSDAEIARMQRILRRAAHTFAITDELGELVQAQFGIAAVTLPLTFEPRARPLVPAKDQTFFWAA